MNILVLANFGMGLYKFRKELLQTLINKNHNVTVTFPKDNYVSLIEEIGCKFEHTDVDRRGTNPLSDGKLMFQYYKLIKKVKPDIVLTYTIKPNIYGGLVCSMLNLRFLPNITGAGKAIENGGILRKFTFGLYRKAFKKVDTVYFQNEDNMNNFLNEKIISKEEAFLIPGSGVNTKEYNYLEYPPETKFIRFLYIGRILKSKGIDELLQAIKIIKSKYENVKFDIVGFCDEDYEDILTSYEENEMLEYHGQKTDIIPFLKNSNAIILPSYFEGMSNVLLEAAASGRPILASNVPGCKETFDEGISGYGFEVKNAERLTEKIEMFINLLYEKKLTMGVKGREKMVKQFNREIIIKAYLEAMNID